MNVESYMVTIAEFGRRVQGHFEKDFRDDDGILVCGICGKRKEKRIDPAKYRDIMPYRREPMIVPCMCECDREKRRQEEKARQQREAESQVRKVREASLIDSKLEEARFDRFDKDKDSQTIFKRCWRYATSFDQMVERNQGLLFWGDIGTGKSFAAACIVNYLLERKVPVIMTSFVKLLEVCGSREESDIINRMRSAKLVVFDDLGAERGTDYALEKVYNIVDSRYRSKLPMIVTTNLTVDDMIREEDLRYSRIYDRIIEVCFPMQFTGPSWRKRSAYKRFEEMRELLDREE